MKKALTSGLVLSMLVGIGSALADEQPIPLATQSYVDKGLQTVYTVVKETQSTLVSSDGTGLVQDVQVLETKVGNAESGLTKDVADLQAAVGGENSGLLKDVADLKNSVNELGSSLEDASYHAGTGIEIDASKNVSVKGLAATTEEANQSKKYIYQNGVLTALGIESNWPMNN